MPDYNWTGGELPTFVTHLECSMTGERYEADRLHGLSRAGRPLLVRYDLDGVRRALPPEARGGPPPIMLRPRGFLAGGRPEKLPPLGGGVTPPLERARR